MENKDKGKPKKDKDEGGMYIKPAKKVDKIVPPKKVTPKKGKPTT